MSVVPTAIVDKAIVYREGLTHICSRSRFRINAGCSDLSDLPVGFLTKGLHQIVIVSLDERAANVLAQIKHLKSQYRSLHVCILSDLLDPDELLAVIEAGADAFLLKNEINAEILLSSLELLLLGQVVISCTLMHLITSLVHVPQVLRQGEGLSRFECRPSLPMAELRQDDCGVQLSNRELAILRQLTLGASNKRIARELSIAEATIKVHMRSVLRKIRAGNRTQAAMWAMQHLAPTAGDATADH